jgi:hypothetical protein
VPRFKRSGALAVPPMKRTRSGSSKGVGEKTSESATENMTVFAARAEATKTTVNTPDQPLD